jgi:hypothetical protein
MDRAPLRMARIITNPGSVRLEIGLAKLVRVREEFSHTVVVNRWRTAFAAALSNFGPC